MVDRIRKVMGYYQLSHTNFADTIDINRSSLTHIFSGRNQPSLDVAKKILKAFPDVNTEWLVMGMGPMLKNETASEPSVTTVDNMSQTDLFGNYDEDTASKTTDEPTTSQIEDAVSELVAETTEDAPARKSTTPTRNRRNTDSNISTRESKRDRISDSQGDKKIVKIVFFYDDHSFEEYRPR